MDEKKMSHSTTTISTTDTSSLTERCAAVAASKHSSRVISLIGIVSLLFTVFLWVSGNYLVKEVVSTNFKNPFLIVYFTQLSYMFYFIFLKVNDPFLKWISSLRKKIIVEDDKSGGDSCVDLEAEEDVSKTQLEPISNIELCKISAIFTCLYLLSNWSFSTSLVHTTVTTASILATTSAFTTLVIGIPLGIEYISGLRILSCTVCFFAVVLVLLSNGTSQGWFGNLMAIGSSILNGIYSIYLRKASVDESRLNIPLIFAIGGVYTLFIGLIPFYILHSCGIEPIPPMSEWPFSYIFVNVFVCGLLPNYLWNIAFICNSPFTVAIGTSFALPLTFIIDYSLSRNSAHTLTEYFAAFLMVISCLLVNMSQLYPDWDVVVEGYLIRKGIVHKGFFGKDSHLPTDQRMHKMLKRAMEKEISKK